MKLRWAILLISIIYILAYFGHASHLRRTVYGDGIFYYSWLRSVVIDHDINFSNEYELQQVSQPLTPTGLVGNKYSVGPAMLWAPAYITVHLLAQGNGWELPYQFAVGVTSVFAAIAGLVLLTRMIRTSPSTASLTLLLIAGATNLLFYGAIDPVNSHALSFFLATVFLAFMTAPKRNWVVIGVVLALLASVRLHDVLYIIALIPLWKHIRWQQLVGGFVLGFLPQLAAWYVLYGTLANPYLTGGETFAFLHPNILGVLFGASSGLFLWTPIVALGIAGLIFPRSRSVGSETPRAHRLVYFAIFAAQLYLVASWSTWWQGASVSGRMFVSSLPVVAIGLERIVRIVYKRKLLRSTLLLMVLGICIVNAIGIFYYLFTY